MLLFYFTQISRDYIFQRETGFIIQELNDTTVVLGKISPFKLLLNCHDLLRRHNLVFILLVVRVYTLSEKDTATLRDDVEIALLEQIVAAHLRSIPSPAITLFKYSLNSRLKIASFASESRREMNTLPQIPFS